MGRKYKYTPIKFDKAIDKYIKSVRRTVKARDDEGYVIKNDDGEVVTYIDYIIQPSIYDFCDKIKIDASTFKNYEKIPDYKDACERLKSCCEHYLVTEVVKRKKGVQGIIFCLQNNYGWRDKKEIEVGEKTLKSFGTEGLSMEDKIKLIKEAERELPDE